MANRLARATSPYLRQHAGNPVDWYPWGEEALTRARRENKPILLSIGYSACHWCHVMAHESFEDPAVAAAMNADFVNIKVDREERPDLDQIYQTAHALMARRSGGWPLTVFIDTAGRALFRRDVFPETLPSWSARISRHPAAACSGVSRAGSGDRGAERASRASDERHWNPRPSDALPAQALARALAELYASLRSRRRRLRQRPQVSARAGARIVLARMEASRRCGSADDRPHDAVADGRRRYRRSARRRLLSLQRRRAMVDSAFRENALRQRGAARALRRRGAGDRGRGLRRCRARDRRLARTRDARARWRVVFEPRCRQRRRGREVLRLGA